MEPITTFLLLSVVAGMISGTYLFFLNNYGKRVIGVAVNNIKQRYQNIFAKRNIAILGYKGSGKTSLIFYLQSGKPLAIKNNEVHRPEPTVGSVVIDSTVRTYNESDKKRLAKIIADVSGDKAFRHLWKELIKDIDPHGIIYMLDGKLGNTQESITTALEPIFNDIFSYYTENINYKNVNSYRLQVFHIFISFSDHWATSKSTIAIKESMVKMAFLKEFEQAKFKHLESIRFNVSTMNLSPNANEWKETDRALNQFGADLNDG
ncbi:MAG: hypothetical protein KME30_08735 [Iphinoe sp. HA4291-MV1]|jgi:GTPase SAR1 family protein|nr:hypothetical protein [Iphinoe sp. HA4291-MV1]